MKNCSNLYKFVPIYTQLFKNQPKIYLQQQFLFLASPYWANIDKLEGWECCGGGGGGGYSHILAIRVCAAGEGMVFKPFGLVKGMVFKPFGLV